MQSARASAAGAASLAARNKTDNEKAALDLRDALPVVGELADFVVEFGKARGT